MKKVTISCIVPVYNVETYISECIESIIKQSYPNLEIILVDDGATDMSGVICDKYAAKDKRIKVVHKQNGGLVSARKVGFDIAKGEYIIIVDGDDYILPDMCDKMLQEALLYDADMVDCCYIRNDKNIINKKNVYHEVIDLREHDDTKNLVMDWMHSDSECKLKSVIWGKLYKAELIKKSYRVVPNEYSFGEDWINFLSLLKLVKKILIIPDAYYIYRVRPTSLSHEKNQLNYIRKSKLNLKIVDILMTEYSDIGIETIQSWYCKESLLGMTFLDGSDLTISFYKFSDIEKIRGKRIILYGAGKVGVSYYTQLRRYRDIDIISWADKNYSNFKYDFCNIDDISVGLANKYDYIVVAVRHEEVANRICRELQDRGVATEKLLWAEPRFN